MVVLVGHGIGWTGGNPGPLTLKLVGKLRNESFNPIESRLRCGELDARIASC